MPQRLVPYFVLAVGPENLQTLQNVVENTVSISCASFVQWYVNLSNNQETTKEKENLGTAQSYRDNKTQHDNNAEKTNTL